MEDEKSAGLSSGGGGELVAVLIEPEDENKSGRIIALVQWRTKRAPDDLRVGGLQFSLHSKVRTRVAGQLA